MEVPQQEEAYQWQAMESQPEQYWQQRRRAEWSPGQQAPPQEFSNFQQRHTQIEHHGFQQQPLPPEQQQHMQTQANPNVPVQSPYFVDPEMSQQQFEQNVQSMFGIGQQQQGGNAAGVKMDGRAYEPSTNDVNQSSFLTALSLNAALFVALIAGYEVFRRLMPSVYDQQMFEERQERKRRNSSDSFGTHVSEAAHSLPPPTADSPASSTTGANNTLPRQSAPALNLNTRTPLGWISGVARAPWSSVRSRGGLDSYMFLRYVRLCFRIVFASSVWGLTILWPVFASGTNGAGGWYYFSMANLEQGSVKLWIPAVFMWFQTFYVMFAMNDEYKHYLECRVDFLARGDGAVHCRQHMYSLLVERIPHHLRSDRALYHYFDRLFPKRVHSAAVVMNIPDLERISEKRRRVLRRLEKSAASMEARRGKRPFHVVGRKRIRCCGIELVPYNSFKGRHNVDDDATVILAPMGGGEDRMPHKGDRVDSIQYYSRELAIMNERVSKMQREKEAMAEGGGDEIRASQWLSQAIGRVTDVASSTLSGAPAREDGLILGFETSHRRRKSLLTKMLDRLGFDFVCGGFEYIQRNIDEVVDSVVGSATSSTGFVTFRDLSTVTCAVRTPLLQSPDSLVVQMAPEPRDIIWENAHVNLAWSKGREWTANVLLGVGAILWSIPVASIQAMANVETIAAVPGMAWINQFDGGELAGFVNGYLPVVLLLTLILALPIIFHGVALHYEDRKTQADIQKSIIGRYFYYQLANIYITVTAGSVLDSLAEIVEHPGNILAILGKSLPTVVGYFLTFIMTKTLVGLPLILLRGGALCRMLFLKVCFREKYLTQAELDEVYRPQMLWYGWEYPNLLLVIVICFTYSCISPIILPVGALYFLGAWLVYKKQILIVYKPWYESGGTMFPMACHRTLIGLVGGQMTLMGYSVLREGFYQALVLFPLPFITIQMMGVFKRLYVFPGDSVSLSKAIDLDTHRNEQTSFCGDVYRQPVLAEKIVEPQPYRRSAQVPVLETMSNGLASKAADSGKIV